jgi:hypothetical protein
MLGIDTALASTKAGLGTPCLEFGKNISHQIRTHSE